MEIRISLIPDTIASAPQFLNQSSVHASATRTLTKPRLRRPRRVKRKIAIDNNDGEDRSWTYFVVDSYGGYGCGASGGGGGGGGGWWGHGGHGGGGANWGEFSDNSVSDPAFDFVYKVLCWIAMSNCLCFALKKVAKFAFCPPGKGSDAVVLIGGDYVAK